MDSRVDYTDRNLIEMWFHTFKMKELTTYSLVKTERKSQGLYSGSYLELTFGENPNTIIETLLEDSRLKDVHVDELLAVVWAQINQLLIFGTNR